MQIETEAEVPKSSAQHADADSRPSDESTAAPLNEDATAEATKNVQTADEEKETPPTTSNETEGATASHSVDEKVDNSEDHPKESLNDPEDTRQ
ncbi:unnamed protein product, partial [Dibothriocephalus latus]